MNKKTIGIFAVIIAIACVAGLVMVNRNQNTKQEELANAKQLQVTVGSEEKIYSYSESGSDYISFNTQMKRKNGDVFDKNYSGIELSAILKAVKVDLKSGVTVLATCSDNYQVELTAEEILAEKNIYLVTKEGGEPLAEADGPFMLVINNDEFSTRWAKNVVSLTVK